MAKEKKTTDKARRAPDGWPANADATARGLGQTPPPLPMPPQAAAPTPPALPEAPPATDDRHEAEFAPSGDGEVGAEGGRRVARRRPAGPARQRIAANDDAPTIGGLIFALEQNPSNRPFVYAGIFSAAWGALGALIGGVNIYNGLAADTPLLTLLASPMLLLSLAAIGLPIGVVWFLALLAWRAEELRLRSSTMTEVAVRLAEPDRMAEQAISSLGQNVRRQVSFMNDAVSRALGRAGELEALVSSEVAALDRSYEENEKRIRGLIQELSGERHALLNTSERVATTLRTLGNEVPMLIDRLADQQVKISEIITGASHNLTSLETAMKQSAGQLEMTLGSRTTHLQSVLENYSSKIDVALQSHNEGLEKQSEHMQGVLENYTTALGTVLSARSDEMQAAFDDSIRALDSSLGNRTENLQTVFEEYARALDTTLANRAQDLDTALVDRTASLDAAFTRRLEVFDESVRATTQAIDGAVNERARALTHALEQHAQSFRESMSRQAVDIDESLMQGINAVRRSSENITRQSLKAIEGLAGQSEMLKNVSENLLGRINAMTGRFENQNQSIIMAANALESANYKIDATLKARQTDLMQTLEQISGTADMFGRTISSYSSSIEEKMSEAERRARIAAEELRAGAEARSRDAMVAIENFRHSAQSEGDRAIEDMRRRFSTVTGEVKQHLGSLTEQVTDATQEMRARSAQAAAELAEEQARLRAQLASLPATTRESTEAMRRSLHDQLAALDKLNQLTNRTAQLRDVAPPVGHLPVAQRPPMPAPSPAPFPPVDAGRGLSSLGAGGFADPGMPQRGGMQGGLQGGMPGEPPQGWSFGDLLARASKDEEHGFRGGHGAGNPSAPSGPFVLDVNVIARALDPATADALWTRLRAGHRGLMVRSIYSPEGRLAFDEISRRSKTDRSLQDTIDRYLADFEGILREAEMRDPSGRLVQQHLVSDTGRVYLFLAHATGRLA